MNANMVKQGYDLKVVQGIVPLNAAAGTVNGTGIDRRGFQSVVLESSCGASEGTPDSFTFGATLEHSDALGSGYAAFTPSGGVAADAVVANLTAINTRKRKTINLSGAKQYVRVAGVTAFVNGTSPKLNRAVTMILRGAVEEPAQSDD